MFAPWRSQSSLRITWVSGYWQIIHWCERPKRASSPEASITCSLLFARSVTLKKKYARTNVLKYSFFHRITDQWNQLPLDICVSDNVIIFKTRVKNFFSDF